MTLARLCVPFACCTLLACSTPQANVDPIAGSDGGALAGDGGDGAAIGAGCDVPADTTLLYAFLSAAQYRSFVKQPAIHGASGPHAKFAQVYANAVLAGEPASAAVHPRCSALVKEFYSSATAQKPFGWAVSIKVAEASSSSDPGDGWFWYENFHAESNQAKGSAGNTVCTGCHAGPGDDGVPTVDFVKSPLPLR